MSTTGLESSPLSPPQYVNPMQLLLVPKGTASLPHSSNEGDKTPLEAKPPAISQPGARSSNVSVYSPRFELPQASQAAKNDSVEEKDSHGAAATASPAQNVPSLAQTTFSVQAGEKLASTLPVKNNEDQSIQDGSTDVSPNAFSSGLTKDVSSGAPPKTTELTTSATAEDDIQIIFSAPVRRKPMKMVLASNPITGMISYGRVSAPTHDARNSQLSTASSNRQSTGVNTAGMTTALTCPPVDSKGDSESFRIKSTLSIPGDDTLNTKSPGSSDSVKACGFGNGVDLNVTNSKLPLNSSDLLSDKKPTAKPVTNFNGVSISLTPHQQGLHTGVDLSQPGKRSFATFQEGFTSSESTSLNSAHPNVRQAHAEVQPSTYTHQVSSRSQYSSNPLPHQSSTQQQLHATPPQFCNQSVVSQNLNNMHQRINGEGQYVSFGGQTQNGWVQKDVTTNAQNRNRKSGVSPTSACDSRNPVRPSQRSPTSASNRTSVQPPVYKSLYDIPEWPGTQQQEQAQSNIAKVAFMSPHQQSGAEAHEPPPHVSTVSGYHFSRPSMTAEAPYSLNTRQTLQPIALGDMPATKDPRKLILDIAKTCETVFPFNAVAQRHNVHVQEVFEVFSALFQVPALEANEKIAAQKLKDYEVNKREMELRNAQEAKQRPSAKPRQRKLQ